MKQFPGIIADEFKDSVALVTGAGIGEAVAPGYVATSKILESGREVTDWMAGMHPVKRLAEREEAADPVAYLLSPRAA